jgi:hypothetical protein
VASDPEIMRETPVFKETRIPVDLVAGMLAQSATMRTCPAIGKLAWTLASLAGPSTWKQASFVAC